MSYFSIALLRYSKICFWQQLLVQIRFLGHRWKSFHQLYFFEKAKIKNHRKCVTQTKNFFVSSKVQKWERISVTRFGKNSPLWRHHFKSIGQIFRVYLVFVKLLILLSQKWYAFGQVLIVVDNHILKYNLAIWSHWKEWNFRRAIIGCKIGISCLWCK